MTNKATDIESTTAEVTRIHYEIMDSNGQKVKSGILGRTDLSR